MVLNSTVKPDLTVVLSNPFWGKEGGHRETGYALWSGPEEKMACQRGSDPDQSRR